MSEPAPSTLARRLRLWCGQYRLVLGLLALLVVFALSSIPNTHPPRIRNLDKAQHIVEYFFVALVFLNIATRGYTRIGVRGLAGSWLAVMLTTLLDETYQRWIPGRSFDVWDMTASGAGGLMAVGTVVVAHAVLVRSGRPDA